MKAIVTIFVLALILGSPAFCSALDESWITYRLESPAEVFRVEASTGIAPENVSDALDTLTPRADDIWLNTSPDGSWLLLETERWGCTGWACLARVKGDISEGGLVTIAGAVIHPEGFSAISSDGNRVVWVGESCGVHTLDLWTATFSEGSWGAASCLTASSPGDWNQGPALSSDGTEVLFSCGENICRVSTAGTNPQVEISLADFPGTGDWIQIKSPDFDPEGNIVFEGEAGGEQIWRKNSDAGTFELINSSYSNDNSPCVLPDGRIASLWLNRPGNPTGVHELKVMDPDGGNELMLVSHPVDVFDVGIGCGGVVGILFVDGFEDASTGSWSSTAGG